MQQLKSRSDAFLKYWVPVIAWMAVIFWMSTGTFSSENTSSVIEPILYFLIPTISSESVDLTHWLIRKSGHVIEYFILGLLLFRALRGRSRQQWHYRWALTSLIIATLYALGDEFHQSFVATRTASIIDVGLDGIGGICSQIVVILLSSRYRK